MYGILLSILIFYIASSVPNLEYCPSMKFLMEVYMQRNHVSLAVVACYLFSPIFTLNTAYACSLPEGGTVPPCPSGQYFDVAASCACTIDNREPIQQSAGWPTVAQHCKGSEDCITVTIDAPCIMPMAINKEYRKEAADYLRQKSSRSFCTDASVTPCRDSPSVALTDTASENRDYCISEAICVDRICKIK